MIVITMKQNNLIVFLLLYSFTCFSQKAACNRETLSKTYQKFLPGEVCVPNNYIITNVYSKNDSIDFNKDGLIDCVFAIKKKREQVGDSSFLYFYFQNIDSTFTFFKRLGNVYPLYFDPNEEVPKLSTEAQKVFDCYIVPNPLRFLGIKNDFIEIIRDIDGHNFERLIFVYQYVELYKDWVLKSKTLIRGEEVLSYRIAENILLKDFSYCLEY